MFRCEKCKKIVPPKEKSFLLVVEKRPKIYHINIVKTIIKRRPGKGRKKKKIYIIKKATGWEIKKEIRVCKECWEKERKSSEAI